MKDMNADQKYLVQEFYEDYRNGELTRREFVKLMAYISGTMAAAVATMALAGCTPEELPNPNDPMPTLEPPTVPQQDSAPEDLVPVPGAKSPFSVPEGDPSVISEDITMTSLGDKITAYLARPASDRAFPAVLICHENRGLNPHIRDVTRRFAKAGYAALAIDLLSREGGSATLDPSQAPGLLGNAGTERHVADFVAGFEFLRDKDFVDGNKIGMTGFCFGGGITWETAVAITELKAAVPFYGRSPDVSQVANIKAAVLGVYAEQDSRINASIPELEAALMDSGVVYQFNIYPGVDHAFHNDTGSRYREEQATQAWLDMLAWFEVNL